MYAQEEILINDELIGEFIGVDIHFSKSIYKTSSNCILRHLIDNLEKGYLKFHESWDWLKPVIDKIIKTIGLRTIDECTEEEWFQCTRITRMYIGVDIETAYHYVIEWIKWYNNENKSKV